tara:strand:+ start:1547 stop:1939 length:393 start_codon:yes stop_codon:yes gene_type:complete
LEENKSGSQVGRVVVLRLALGGGGPGGGGGFLEFGEAGAEDETDCEADGEVIVLIVLVVVIVFVVFVVFIELVVGWYSNLDRSKNPFGFLRCAELGGGCTGGGGCNIEALNTGVKGNGGCSGGELSSGTC